MNAKQRQIELRPGLVAVRVGERWAAVERRGEVGRPVYYACAGDGGAEGAGDTPWAAIQAARPVTYRSIRELREALGEPEPVVYTVIVSDGYTPTGPSVQRSCGHNHQTREAAEECLQHLRRVRYVRGQREESATWYNATVLPHLRGSWARVEE